MVDRKMKKHIKASAPISVQDENRAAEILGRVRRMEVRTNRLVDDSLAGRYASVFKGRGMDFDRVRNYVPGDDVRTIDWNVTARTGEAHVKLFTEERELTIMLVIDVSASSDFGSVRTRRPSTGKASSSMVKPLPDPCGQAAPMRVQMAFCLRPRSFTA